MLEFFSKGLTFLSRQVNYDEGAMVRLMAIEYSKDYNELRKNGFLVDEKIASRFIKAQSERKHQ